MSKKILAVLAVGAAMLLVTAVASATPVLIPLSVEAGASTLRNPLSRLVDQTFNNVVYSGDSNNKNFWFVVTPAAGGSFQVDHIMYKSYDNNNAPGTPLQITVGNALDVHGEITGGTSVPFTTGGYAGNTNHIVTWDASVTAIGTGNYQYMEVGLYAPPANTHSGGNTGGSFGVEIFGTATPEPATMTLLVIGGIGALLRRRRGA
jgi:hypothetical protein